MKNQSVKLTYAAAGDYFISNIALTEAASENIGKYGRMRKRYLEEHRPGLYNWLVLSENLQAHLLEIEGAARNRLNVLLPRLAETAGAMEELKAADPLRWVGLMNNCKAQAEEVILSISPSVFSAINATYSELCEFFRKHSISTVDTYVAFANAFWLNDKSAPFDKVTAYYNSVVNS